MKLPKKTSRYCPTCNKNTEQKLALVSTGGKRGSLKRGGKVRVKMRGKWRGMGNLGKYSKPAINSRKRKTKSTKRLVVIYTCQTCKKSHQAKCGRRVSKIQFEEPQTKQ